MQDCQTKTTFVATNAIFQQSDLSSMASGSEVGFDDIPNNEEFRFLQNLNATEVRKRFTDDQIVPLDQVGSLEDNSLHLEQNIAASDNVSHAEVTERQSENTTNSN